MVAGFPRPVSLGLPAEAIEGLYGTLASDPRTFTDGRGMGYLDVQQSTGKNGARASAQARVLVFFPADSMLRLGEHKDFGRGSTAFIEGEFLEKGENEERVFRARAVHSTTPAPALDQIRTGIRIGIIDRFEGHPWGGLSLALLLGVKDSLDRHLSASYTGAGCAHVLALSGMHLAIVAAILAFFLKKPLGLKAAALTGAGFIVCYVYLVGDLPSLNRAAIMYLLGTLAIMGMLPRKPGLILALSFLIQIIIWPSSGRSVSFILSYSALAGILLLGEAFHDVIRKLVPELLGAPLSASLGAFLATAAVVAGVFGMLRPVGILAGLVIVPVTTLFMIVSLIFLVLSGLSVIPFLAGAAGSVLTVLYEGLETLVLFFGKAPGIPVSHAAPVVVLTGIIAGVLLIGSARLRASRSRCDAFD
jgi:competence protein ComEC